MNNSGKILVIDDEQKIVDVVTSYLQNSGYTVYFAYNGKDAIKLFERMQPDLIVLDLMLPDISGEEICRAVRMKSRVPIMMLTAKAEEENVLEGLNIGADDYMTKPFSPRQLLARVNALLRRTAADNAVLSDNLSFNNNELVIDNIKHEVRKNGAAVNLTPNEYKFLIILAKNPSKVFTRDDLISKAFGYDFIGFDRTIDTHIKNLRRKIENDTKNPKYILTVYGVGYRFGGENSDI